MSWAAFMERTHPRDHGVQIYADVDELAASVGRYVAAGFRAGAPAVVIATGTHRQRFGEELAARGWDPGDLLQQGRLTFRDADVTLAALMVDGWPSFERLALIVGSLLDEVASRFPGKTIRVFGEMVDILWSQGRQQAAIALEELWDELATSRRFALLCGYRMDIFDLDVQTGALPEIFRTHSHARPAADPSRLSAAVDRALAVVVGPVAAAHAYLDLAERVPRGMVPRGQALLTWLSATDAPLAKDVLERARTQYSRSVPRDRL